MRQRFDSLIFLGNGLIVHIDEVRRIRLLDVQNDQDYPGNSPFVAEITLQDSIHTIPDPKQELWQHLLRIAFKPEGMATAKGTQ